MKTAQLFVEILVEELPALPFLREFQNFEEKWKKVLSEYKIECLSEFFYTPRRIVICSSNFPLKTQDEELEVFGPPVEIAFKNADKNQDLTPAGEAFLKKNNLLRSDMSFCMKNGKEVLYAKTKLLGIETKDFIALCVEKFLASLHFGKHMRWGEVKDSFIRPIRNIAIFLDEVFIKSCAYGLNSVPKTLVHRDCGYEYHDIKNFSQYQKLLQENGVILSQDTRRELILDAIRALEKKHNLFIEIDLELLDEVVAITENPSVILGVFEERFLELPKEVIITSMKENQRYFGVYQDKDLQKLSNHFVMVSNSMSKDQQIIVAGNQKVLRARLEDAMFFYHNDIEQGLKPEGLSKIVFIDGAGSMEDKVNRELKIVEFLHSKIASSLDKNLLLEAIRLSKADLLSEMVYEFPNLQGLMGYYYAKHMGLDDRVAVAIKEQYLPTGEKSTLPSSLFSALVALANKFDNILMLFAMGKIPTGSKDPFALRRAANGILRILLDQKISFHLKEDLMGLIDKIGYKNVSQEQIFQFFIERFDGILNVNPSLIKSVLLAQEYDVCNIVAKIEALNIYLLKEKDTFVSTFKRVANILKQEPKTLHIDSSLFESDVEKELFEAYQKVASKQYKNYLEQMEELCVLKPLLDRFFDNVMVNVEDDSIKQNRIALIANIYYEFLKIADVKEISI